MRVFVAVEINDQNTLDNIIQFQNDFNIDAKAILPNQIHFTLQFLGEIDEKIIERIINMLTSIKFSKFDLSLIHI